VNVKVLYKSDYLNLLMKFGLEDATASPATEFAPPS
jgi:hypothetical protein